MKKYFIIMLLALPFAVGSCYYDKYEELYPVSFNGTNNCDTSGKYSTVSQTFALYCVSCHDANLNSGGYRLDTYDGAHAVAMSGRLAGAVNHAPGYSAMPQGTDKLDSCRIKAIENWVSQGAPNN